MCVCVRACVCVCVGIYVSGDCMCREGVERREVYVGV